MGRNHLTVGILMSIVSISGNMWELLESPDNCKQMFRGVNNINLDAKGRLAIPTRYRESLYENSNGSLVMTISHSERCLWVFPIEEWAAMEQKLVKLPNLNNHAARLQRLLVGHATDVDMDKNGRILISPPLREYAGLDKNVVMIGQINKFEIWSDAHWNERRDVWLAEDFSSEMLPIDLESLSL